jgi:hypothetical protein
MSSARLRLAVVFFALPLAAIGCGSEPSGPTLTDSYTVTWGPLEVPAQAERTQCVVKRLGNTDPARIAKFHNVLGLSSHHLIVYRVADTVEQPTPVDCTPFFDLLDPAKGSPLVITQKPDDTLELPRGVAYTLEANQMVRLEMHYVNATTMPRIVEATSTFTAIPDAEFRDEASFLFIGNPDINIAAMSQATVGPSFFPVGTDFESVNFFGITGHTHQWGTQMVVSNAANAGDPGTALYDVPGWRWDEPATVKLDPPLKLAPGAGFRFSCGYDNKSAQRVYWGEDANDEMCFFWAYYYPSKGAKVCIHTDRFGGQDLCCPGSDLCRYFDML